MLLPLQARTNVRDVLAPLFCNGRSFANLIDELSRHFKLEPHGRLHMGGHGGGYHSPGAHHDADDDMVMEASSESQSTDSEAEVRDGGLDNGRDRAGEERACARSQYWSVFLFAFCCGNTSVCIGCTTLLCCRFQITVLLSHRVVVVLAPERATHREFAMHCRSISAEVREYNTP